MNTFFIVLAVLALIAAGFVFGMFLMLYSAEKFFLVDTRKDSAEEIAERFFEFVGDVFKSLLPGRR